MTVPISIGYDAGSGALVIVGNGVYPAGTLTVEVVASTTDHIRVWSLARRGEQYIAWTDVRRLDPNDSWVPATMADALAYLQGEFAKRPAVGLPPLTFTAGENMGGQRAVRVTGDGLVYLASADDPSEVGDTLGISMNAALTGAPVTVMIEGEMDDPSWSFAPGPLFLGLAGALTQDVPAAPAAAFRQKLATVLSPTRLLIERSFPVLLA